MSPAVGPALVPCGACGHAKIARVKMSFLTVSALRVRTRLYVEYIVPSEFSPTGSEILRTAITRYAERKSGWRQSAKLIDLPTSPTVLELQQGNSGKPRTCRFVLMMRFDA